jgi:hypothetical protein
VKDESLTITIFSPASGFSRLIRVLERLEQGRVPKAICSKNSPRIGNASTRWFVLPVATVLGCALTACSDRVARTISADDRPFTETAGFLSIIILAIVGLFGPIVYQWWRQK